MSLMLATKLLLPTGVHAFATQEMQLRAVHHNPHWECFGNDPTGECQPAAWSQYSHFLTDLDMDFGGLIMGGDYSPPANFDVVEGLSQYDKAALIWNTDRWTLEESRPTEFEDGRAGVLGRFQHRRHSTLQVVVASLHYGHTYEDGPSTGADRVGSDIADLLANGTRVLILGDTNALAVPPSQPSNRDPVKTTLDLANELNILHDDSTPCLTTPALPTCCADWQRILGPPDNETWRQPFDLTFDRIFSNFGQRLHVLEDQQYEEITSHYKRAPRWAEQVMRPGGSNVTAAYHHPVMAMLDFTILSETTSAMAMYAVGQDASHDSANPHTMSILMGILGLSVGGVAYTGFANRKAKASESGHEIELVQHDA